MAKIEGWLLKLKENRVLNSKDEKRLLADIRLVNGLRSAPSSRMQEKLDSCKVFLTSCITSEELGPVIMLLCSLALGVSGVYNLGQPGRVYLIECLKKKKLKTDFLSDMAQEYQVPTLGYHATEFQYRHRCGPGTRMREYMQHLLSEKINTYVNVEMAFPFDPTSNARLTLTMDISQETAWDILPLFDQPADNGPSVVNSTIP